MFACCSIFCCLRYAECFVLMVEQTQVVRKSHKHRRSRRSDEDDGDEDSSNANGTESSDAEPSVRRSRRRSSKPSKGKGKKHRNQRKHRHSTEDEDSDEAGDDVKSRSEFPSYHVDFSDFVRFVGEGIPFLQRFSGSLRTGYQVIELVLENLFDSVSFGVYR